MFKVHTFCAWALVENVVKKTHGRNNYDNKTKISQTSSIFKSITGIAMQFSIKVVKVLKFRSP